VEEVGDHLDVCEPVRVDGWFADAVDEPQVVSQVGVGSERANGEAPAVVALQ
jgi:hypothetical protein